jgi:hypothetical protein
MSLQIHATVTNATNGRATLEAKADEVVTPDGWQRDADAINATTEGTIKTAKLELSFDGDCPLVKGQVVTIESDFAPAEPGDEDQTPTPVDAAPSEPTTRPRPAKKAPAKKAPAKKAASKRAPAKKAAVSR